MYDGHLTLADGRRGGATASLDGAGVRVAGTLSLSAADAAVAGDFAVSGRRHGARMTLQGASSAGTRVNWRGRSRDGTTVEGVLRTRGPGGRRRARLALATRTAGSSACDDLFAGDVMSRVLLPVCSACHTPGGAAQATRLQVLPDDVSATRAAVAVLIDAADPPSSLLLQKPVGGLGHGGGRQLAPGGPEMQILEHWVTVATGPECAGSGPSGPGGGSPGGTLYTNHCASCHGADARGVGGRPAILCNRDVTDPVKSGRRGPTQETTMPPFLKLTDADIDLLQGYLNDLCPAATASGADLFVGNCGVCHGADARGGTAPDVHCARAIGDLVRDGVTGVFGGMPAMLRLTDPEIQRMQDHLLGLCPLGSASGATLYAGNCAGCHGTNGEGDGNRRPDVRCSVQSRIDNAVRKGRGFQVPVMPTFSTSALTDAELASVRAFIAPHCSGQGADLFASNCATCHGATGNGGQNANGVAGPGIRCSSSGDVYDAVVDGTGGMPALADMTNPQIDAVVTFLGTGCH
jgi:mono/diheme cytochrome c family protein